MDTVFAPTHALHAPAREFLDGRLTDYLESPTRAELIRTAVGAAGLGVIRPPEDRGLGPIMAVHDADYIGYLQTIHAEWVAAGGDPGGVFPDTFLARHFVRRSKPPAKPGGRAGVYHFDLSAVVVEGTWQAAYDSAQTALTAAALVEGGARSAFGLCRPPGHHAHADMSGGYCFLNNIAIAAEWLIGRGSARIAILDIDFHHGNGTQHLFYDREDVLFVSLHADPDRQYPYFMGYADETGAGRGLGFTRNLPLPLGCDDAAYLEALDSAADSIRSYQPDVLLISLGVDTFKGDPLGDFALTTGVYGIIGARLAELGAPTVFIMEGGYAIRELGDNIASVLRGFETAA